MNKFVSNILWVFFILWFFVVVPIWIQYAVNCKTAVVVAYIFVVSLLVLIRK